MNFRLPATALCAVALPVLSLISGPASAETRDFAAIARTAGKPKIPDLDVVWMAPWGDRARAHRWENIIVHQTETQPGTAKILAEKQNKDPLRRGVTIWVETDGKVYWSVPEHLVPTHGDGANRNDNRYIDNSTTYRQVVGNNSIGVEFVGNAPDVTRGATRAQIKAWKILVRVLRTRYDIPAERIFAHNWIDRKDERYCEGCALATLAKRWEKSNDPPARRPREGRDP